ncbi:Cysteine desulfurase [Hibiscus syriacus]|uniref:Cysteine desulfurase n=1 Tax=Hibiscus syriacus TaxID=106335 RepID=A0A6A2YGU5_HIBSY|nr:Cysteine desulfurase [Hibiscus syriacus]
MSLSGHKIYGPKGVGALYMRRRPRIRVESQMNGGGQERGIRSGTVPTPLVFGIGAACELALKEMDASSEPSYVLRALGVDEDMAHTSIRFGIGRFTTEEEIDKAVELTVKQVEKLREMSPLYEMVKEGIDIKQIQWAQH